MHPLIAHSFSSVTLCSWCGKWSFGYCLQCHNLENFLYRIVAEYELCQYFWEWSHSFHVHKSSFLDIIHTTLFKHAISPPNSSEEPTYSHRALVIFLCGLFFWTTPWSFGRSNALPMPFWYKNHKDLMSLPFCVTRFGNCQCYLLIMLCAGDDGNHGESPPCTSDEVCSPGNELLFLHPHCTGRSLHCQVKHRVRTKFAAPILHAIDKFKIYDFFFQMYITIDSIFLIYFEIFSHLHLL